jgi:hypothetical protein
MTSRDIWGRLTIRATSARLQVERHTSAAYIREVYGDAPAASVVELAALAKAKTKATKREPSKTPASRRWRITLLKATPAKFIGDVRAPDAKSAVATAAKDYEVSERLVDRLLATPEEE